MAQLLSWLAISGARTSAGEPVSSGLAWFYEPGGGTTTATVYTDVDGTVIATQPVTLDEGGRATIYTIAPVRVVIQDATGADVSDDDQANVNRAEAVQIDNAGWTDGYLDDALTKLYTSTGGTNGMYLESGGATARTIKSKFSEISVSVKDFGARGDGLTVDTTAILAAINRVAFLGGGIVYFPPGTYLVDQILPLSSKNGVSFKGAGFLVSVIKNTNALNDVLSFSSCASFFIEDLGITNSTTSSGVGIALAGCSQVTLNRLSIGSHLVAVAMSGACAQTLIDNCRLTPQDDANARGVRYVLTGASAFPHTIRATYVAPGNGTGIELDGTTGNITADTVYLNAAAPFKFDNTWTGSGLNIINCALPQAFTVATADDRGMTISPSFGYKTNIGAATFTPDRTKGDHYTLRGTAAASTVNIAVPSLPPMAGAGTRAVEIAFRLWNNSGGNVTWAFAAGYHLTGAFAATADGSVNIFRFQWDEENSVYRETSRAATT